MALPVGYKLVDGAAQNNLNSPVQDEGTTASRTALAYGWFGRILPLSFFDSLRIRTVHNKNDTLRDGVRG